MYLSMCHSNPTNSGTPLVYIKNECVYVCRCMYVTSSFPNSLSDRKTENTIEFFTLQRWLLRPYSTTKYSFTDLSKYRTDCGCPKVSAHARQYTALFLVQYFFPWSNSYFICTVSTHTAVLPANSVHTSGRILSHTRTRISIITSLKSLLLTFFTHRCSLSLIYF